MSELVLSASSVETYATCSYRWFLSYIESTPGEQGVPQAIGLGVHAAAEDYYRSRLRGDIMSPEKVLATGQQSFDLMFLTQTAEISATVEELAQARVEGRRVTESYLVDVSPNVKPLMVEQPFRIDINGIPYSGSFDLVDDLGNVRDLKVKSSMPRYGIEPYLFAGTGYALGYRMLTGRVEADFSLDIMIRLKVKRPYHRVLSHGGPFDEFEIAAFAARLERVATGITQSHFEPTGLDDEPWVCRTCPVNQLCTPYLETIDATP